jgi:hypothetical protein
MFCRCRTLMLDEGEIWPKQFTHSTFLYTGGRLSEQREQKSRWQTVTGIDDKRED